eukprot:3510816-Pyramimonas_sp.AAC.1
MPACGVGLWGRDASATSKLLLAAGWGRRRLCAWGCLCACVCCLLRARAVEEEALPPPRSSASSDSADI